MFMNNHKDNQKRSKSPLIFPLSANPELNNEELPGLNVYHNYLEEAFNEPRVLNIAVTGAFGVGKSSIIQSFEKKYNQDKIKAQREEFIYISLGTYCNGHGIETYEDINALERRLLLQIYTKYSNNELPANSFQMIPEYRKRNFISVISGLMCLAILLLGFHSQVGLLFDALLPWFTHWKTIIHLLIYLLVFLVISGTVGYTVYLYSPKFHIGKLKITAKFNNAEINYDDSIAEDYLDRFTTEILYCLEEIVQKQSRTIVFEDMDRLDETKCLKIFLRLRELNHLVNQRLKRNGNYLRFVYVTNDKITAKLENEKFFDFIMPIIPKMNIRTAERILYDNLKYVNNKIYSDYFWKEGIQQTKDSQERNGLLHYVARYLPDYRLQYNILNEYNLLFRYYLENIGSRKIDEDAAEQLLAFSVYKNFWPEDYDKLHSGESEIIPTRIQHNEVDNWNNKELLKKLVFSPHKFLTARCLYYIGFDRQSVMEWWESNLDNDFKRTINAVSQEDEEAIEVINQKLDEKKFELEDTTDGELIKKWLKCVITCKINRLNWFFNSNRSIGDCLSVLTGFSAEEICVLVTLYELENGKTDSVFTPCKNWGEDIKYERTWSQSELDVFVHGTHSFPYSGAVKVKGRGAIVLKDEIAKKNQEGGETGV